MTSLKAIPATCEAAKFHTAVSGQKQHASLLLKVSATDEFNVYSRAVAQTRPCSTQARCPIVQCIFVSVAVTAYCTILQVCLTN